MLKAFLTISHPLPILNISEHLTRLKLQKNSPDPFGFVSSIWIIKPLPSHIARFTVLGALLGTQNGREVEIVNTFELMVVANDIDVNDPKFHEFLVSRRDQCMSISVLFPL